MLISISSFIYFSFCGLFEYLNISVVIYALLRCCSCMQRLLSGKLVTTMKNMIDLFKV